MPDASGFRTNIGRSSNDSKRSAPFPENNRPGRPFGLWILTLILLGSPAIHLSAVLLRTHWLNFGSLRLWDALVYLLIAPIVGVLMLRRHERARFSVYVFLSCEVLRALRIHSLTLGLVAAGFLLYLQLPASRRFHLRRIAMPVLRHSSERRP